MAARGVTHRALQPGDQVDIYWSGSIQGQETTKLLLEKVELIAIDQIADVDMAKPTVARTVTVEVSPIVVASLAQARNSGRLALALRGVGDEVILGNVAVNQADLLGITEVVEEVKKKCFTRIRQGTQVQVVEVPCSD